MNNSQFDSDQCVQCGRCCLKYGNCLQATIEDIERWESEGRDDILTWVDPSGDLWVDRKTGREASRCPWLRKQPGKDKYACRIHETKPQECKDYPVTTQQGLEDHCPATLSRRSNGQSQDEKTPVQGQNPPDRPPV